MTKLDTLSQEGRELYFYITTNPEPMAILENAYRIAERDLHAGKTAALNVQVSDAVFMCVRAHV